MVSKISSYTGSVCATGWEKGVARLGMAGMAERAERAERAEKGETAGWMG